MDDSPIINHLDFQSQEENSANCPDDDGLRILSRIIAQEFLTKQSARSKKNEVIEDNPPAASDSE